MPYVQVYIENRLLKEVNVSDDNAMMVARKLYRDYKIDMLREMDIYCGVQLFTDKGLLQFDNFGSVRAQSKMNNEDFVPEPAPYDEFIENYRHEQVGY